MFLIITMLLILSIHYKTEKVIELAIAWGIISFFITLPGGFLIAFVGGVFGFIVTWLLFLLANYLEESIFLRLIVLVLTMGIMLLVPNLVEKFFMQ